MTDFKRTPHYENEKGRKKEERKKKKKINKNKFLSTWMSTWMWLTLWWSLGCGGNENTVVGLRGEGEDELAEEKKKKIK